MKKEIVVFEEKSEWSLPKQPDNFLKYWTDKFDQIPAEYRDNACVEIEAVISYYRGEPPEISIKISYLRPETSKERSDMEQQETRRIDVLRQYDLRELERLKNKYNQAQEEVYC